MLLNITHNNLLQRLIRNGMGCTKIAIPYISSAAKARLPSIWIRKRHVATTIRAFHKTHKYIRTSCFIRLFFYTDEFLHQFKGFFINDRFVGVPYYDPFFFRNCNRLLILK